MIRVLLVCWVAAAVLVVWLRRRMSGRLSLATARVDLAAVFAVGGFVWVLWLVRF